MKDTTSSVRADEDNFHTKKDSYQNNTSSASSSDTSKIIENVLILQGGGSLGAFGCGVFKAISKKKM